MGLLRVLNPFVLNPTAPRHRTARAVETLARAQRDADRASAALAAHDAVMADHAAAMIRIRAIRDGIEARKQTKPTAPPCKGFGR